MPLTIGQPALQQNILSLLEDLSVKEDNPQEAREVFAQKLAQFIVDCIKSATVTTTIVTVGSSTTQTGTGIATIT